MKQDLCTIPIQDMFEPKAGCPICRMDRLLEERLLDYILGPAMMEPDIRSMTNQEGFCPDHLKKMLSRRNKLQTALLLETRLAELKNHFSGGWFFDSAQTTSRKIHQELQHCFLCRELEEARSKMLATFWKQYAESLEFRELFRAQEHLCLPHYAFLGEAAPKRLPKKNLDGFYKDAKALANSQLEQVLTDVRRFADMFDYQKREEEDFSDVKDALERAFECLAGEHQTHLL